MPTVKVRGSIGTRYGVGPGAGGERRVWALPGARSPPRPRAGRLARGSEPETADAGVEAAAETVVAAAVSAEWANAHVSTSVRQPAKQVGIAAAVAADFAQAAARDAGVVDAVGAGSARINGRTARLVGIPARHAVATGRIAHLIGIARHGDVAAGAGLAGIGGAGIAVVARAAEPFVAGHVARLARAAALGAAGTLGTDAALTLRIALARCAKRPIVPAEAVVTVHRVRTLVVAGTAATARPGNANAAVFAGAEDAVATIAAGAERPAA